MEFIHGISRSCASLLGYHLHEVPAGVVKNDIDTANYNSIIRLAAQYARPLIALAIIFLVISVLTWLITFLLYVIRCCKRRHGASNKSYRDPRNHPHHLTSASSVGNGLYANVLLGSQKSACVPATLAILLFLLNAFTVILLSTMVMLNEKSVYGIALSAQTFHGSLNMVENYLNTTRDGAAEYADASFLRFEKQMEDGMRSVRAQVLSKSGEILQNFTRSADGVVNRVENLVDVVQHIQQLMVKLNNTVLGNEVINLDGFREETQQLLRSSGCDRDPACRQAQTMAGNYLKWNENLQKLLTASNLFSDTPRSMINELKSLDTRLASSADAGGGGGNITSRIRAQIEQQSDALLIGLRSDMAQTRSDLQKRVFSDVDEPLQKARDMLYRTSNALDEKQSAIATASRSKQWLGIVPVILLALPVVIFFLALFGMLLHTRKKTKKIRYNDYYQSVPVHRSRHCEITTLRVGFIVAVILLVFYALIFDAYLLASVTSFMTLCYNNNNDSSVVMMTSRTNDDSAIFGQNGSKILFPVRAASNLTSLSNDSTTGVQRDTRRPVAFEIVSEFLNDQRYRSSVLNAVDERLNGNNVTSELVIDIGNILDECNRNASLYNALVLKKTSPRSSLSNTTSTTLEDELNRLKQQALDSIRQRMLQFDKRLLDDMRTNIERRQFIPAEFYNRLQQLADDAGINNRKDWPALWQLSQQNIDSLSSGANLKELTALLDRIATNSSVAGGDEASRLQAVSTLLKTTLMPNITEIDATVKQIQNKLNTLRYDFFNQSSPATFVIEIIQRLQALEAETKQRALSTLSDVAAQAPRQLSRSALLLVETIFDEFENDFGRCGAVEQAVMLSTDAVCQRVVVPTLSYTFLFFVVLIVIFISLWLALALADWWQRRSREYEADAAMYDNTFDTYDYYRYG